MNLFRSGVPFWVAGKQGYNTQTKRDQSKLAAHELKRAAIRFAGDKKERKQLEQEAEQTLLKAGVNRDSLLKQWGVILWMLRCKEDAIFLRVDTTENPKVDLKALAQWFQEKLSAFGQVILREGKIRGCCYKGCKGCMAAEPKKNKDWIP